jgi:hypothetical protein
MDILRDESGYVLILRRPRLWVDGNAAEEAVTPVQPAKEAVVAPEPTCAVPHCCFYCSWCGEPILLPNDKIGAPFGNPHVRKIDVRSIATLCNACKHIGNYSMFRACRGFDTRHRMVHAPNSGSTMLLNWLQCVESTCPARVPLFVRFERDPAEVASEVASWMWDDLTCALGHPIKPIPLDPTLQLPVRPFAGSR